MSYSKLKINIIFLFVYLLFGESLDAQFVSFRTQEKYLEYRLNSINNITFQNESLFVENQFGNSFIFKYEDGLTLKFYTFINSPENECVIYPNPVLDKMIINCKHFQSNSIFLYIYAIDSSVILQRQIKRQNPSDKIIIDLFFLQKGIYYCRIKDNNFDKILSFIKN